MKTSIFFVLGLLLISMTSAYTFCENGSKGAIKIFSLADKLDDNYKPWEWGDEQDIRLTFEVENNLNSTHNFTMELIFLDKSGEEAHLASGGLTETQRIRDNDDDRINFDFKIKDNRPHSKYDMFAKLYVTENESNYCVQKEKEIVINSFDSCEDTTSLAIKSIESPSNFSWKLDEEIKIDVEILSSISKDDYEVELIFYDKDSSEQNIVQSSSDLIESISIDNETVIVEFEFQIKEKLDMEKYGLYVKVASDHACAEERIFKTYKMGRSTLKDFMQISIKDTPGIIIDSVVGPTNIISGAQVTYNIGLSNTGETEPKVKVFIYNYALGIKETKVIEDFKKDSKQTINITFLARGAPTKTSLGFFAEYDYINNSGYFESSTTYNHDMELKIELIAPVVAEPKPIPTATPNETIIYAPITVKGPSPYPTIFAILIVLLFITIGVKVYKKYSEPVVSQQFE